MPTKEKPRYVSWAFTFYTAQKIKFSIQDFFSKWTSDLLKKYLMKNFNFCAVLKVTGCINQIIISKSK